MTNKTIVISLPARLSEYAIIKEIRLDDNPSIQIEITNNTSCTDVLNDNRLKLWIWHAAFVKTIE